MTANKKSTARQALHWAGLTGLSLICILVLRLPGLPAAPMLGAMLAGILFSMRDTGLSVPTPLYRWAQSLLGCLIAQSMHISALRGVLQDWPLALFSVFSIMLCSLILGWGLAKHQVLEGPTALWGTWPGAASVMSIMSESYGADMRLVALMQYSRVMLVTLTASIVAALVGAQASSQLPLMQETFPPFHLPDLAGTLLFSLACAAAGALFRFPATSLLSSLIFGVLLSELGILTLELPGWLMLFCYAFFGWSIGLRFTRPIILHALKLLPRMLLSILMLLLMCGGMAVLMAAFTDIDLLTAYLATSPGGADCIAIIAAASDADVPFVMSVQMARFIVVMLIGPYITARLSRRLAKSFAGNKEKP